MAAELVTQLRALSEPLLRHCADCAATIGEAADRIDALESRIADKDASIQQLIEQLQKAEAQSAALERAIQRTTPEAINAAEGRIAALQSALRAMCCPYTDRNCENSVLARALMTDRTEAKP